MKLSAWIQARLRHQNENFLWRELSNVTGNHQAYVYLSHEKYLSFACSDYLGLAQDSRVIASIKVGADKYGSGSSASAVISGYTRAHHELAIELADFMQYPKAMLFSSGYMANLAVITSLVQRRDIIFSDKLNHASLVDASRYTTANVKRYPHLDYKTLQQFITNFSAENRFIISDGVFSMDGDLLPLRELLSLTQSDSVILIMDDAHGIGVLGKHGRGTMEWFNVLGQVPIVVGTLSKAWGLLGAFVVSNVEIIDYLEQFARPHLYTTALPAALALTAKTSLQIIRDECWRREYLTELIIYFRKKVKALGLILPDSITPIQPIILGDTKRAVMLAACLKAHKIFAPVIRPPTVPVGLARLRVCLTVHHTHENIDYFVDVLGERLSKEIQEKSCL